MIFFVNPNQKGLIIIVIDPATFRPVTVESYGIKETIEIAPEDKRPVYSALQVNITSLGLFFPILGGVILSLVPSYTFIYLLTIGLLSLSLYLSLKLKELKND